MFEKILRVVLSMREKQLVSLFLALLVSASFAASNWFVNTEFKQDFRYRWQEEKQEAVFNSAGDKYTRYRERIRYRFGFETKANDEMNFAGRLATGGTTDPLSTNDTLGENDGFTRDTIVLDQAYLRYTPAWIDTSYGVFTGSLGKFDIKDGIYTVTDIQWDSDISLEGKNLAYSYKGIDTLELFSNIGNYLVKESKEYDDYTVAIQQFGAKWQATPVYGLEVAATKMYRTRPNGDDLPTASASMVLGNASIDTRALKFNIDTQALGIPFVQRVSVFGEEYVNASNDSYGNCNMGNASGLEIGTQKLAVFGDWSLRGMNRRLGADTGWTLGDSDVYGGTAGSKVGLNTKGTELEFKLALAENATIGVDQYLIDVMNNGYSDATALNNDKGFQRVTQFDVNVKF